MAERKRHLVRLFRYLVPYWRYILGALLLAFLGALLNLALPWLVEKTIDRALLEKNLRLLVFIALGIVGIFFVKGVASYVQSFWVSLAGFRVITRLRSELYQHLHHLSVAFFQENPPGEIISRMTSDIAVLQNFFSSALVTMLMDLLLFLGSVVFLFFIHWKLALLSIVVFPLVGLCVDILGKRIRGFSHLLQSRVAALTSLVERTVTGIKVIQSYVSGHYEVEKFERENEMNFYLAMKQAKARALFNPLVELVASCGVTAVIWYGGREVIRGFLTPGQLIAFLGYLVIASSPLSRFSSGFQLFQQGLASLERIFEFLDTAPFVAEDDDGVELREFRERISFRNVSFSYKGEKILRNFSLDIRKGEKVGIVGPSGAGKTTIINLPLLPPLLPEAARGDTRVPVPGTDFLRG